MEGNLKGDYLRLMPRLCLEERMNWYASSRWRRVIRLWGQVMEYTYIPSGIKRELVGSGVNCNQKGYIVRIGGMVTIHSSGETIFNFTHIESITLGSSEEVR